MISVERIRDPGLVIQAVTHPRVWPHSSDDFSPPPDEIGRCIDVANHIYVGCWAVDEYLGCYLFVPINRILYDVHTMLLPSAWGATGNRCAEATLKWVWDNLPSKRLTTSVPDNNPLALRYARRVGFEDYGYSPRSIQKGGVLLGQYLLGLDRPHIQGER